MPGPRTGLLGARTACRGLGGRSSIAQTTARQPITTTGRHRPASRMVYRISSDLTGGSFLAWLDLDPRAWFLPGGAVHLGRAQVGHLPVVCPDASLGQRIFGAPD